MFGGGTDSLATSSRLAKGPAESMSASLKIHFALTYK
jgi:hypothetical protein